MSDVRSIRSREVSILWGKKIPLRDGVHLHATVYLPRDKEAAAPCIATLTPYVSDTYHDFGMHFARESFPFVVVDVRGRGNSEGQFRPLIQEADDVHDCIEWLAKQPYCDGQVALWGGSYAGYVQWAAIEGRSSHLRTIVPAASPYPGLDFPMRSNIFYPLLIRWLTYTSGRTSQARLVADDSFWSSLYREWFESGDAFCDIDNRLGSSFPIFQEWLSHPEPDDYWDAYSPSVAQYANFSLPILTITGSYDDDQLGALEHYRRHVGPDEARASNHYLIIGPWDHEGTRAPKSSVGGVDIGPAGLLDLSGLHVEWYRWVMEGAPKPSFLRKRVAYYVMGADEWRYADSLAAVTSGTDCLFLDSEGTANHITGWGILTSTPGDGLPDSYRYDPREIHGPEIEAEARRSPCSLIDQATMVALDGRLLTYDSAVLEDSLEISGFFKLTAWISIDCPDTDVYFAIYEVFPDGRVIRLSTAAMRARYRQGLKTPKLITTVEPLPYDVDSFTFISRRIQKGHRLRLVIAPIGPLMEGNFIQKNYNGGGAVAEEIQGEAKPVTVILFHDIQHPSTLRVPRGEQMQLPSTPVVTSSKQ